MKTQISAVDLHYLAKELDRRLASARFDRVYQIGGKDLKIRLHTTGKGSCDLVITPSYVCVTGYPRKAPERATSFAMQLRKHLDGAYLEGIRQHGFDRILELLVRGKERNYVLIAEFFSRGNVIFCDAEYKILGLLERQSWKDRALFVGQTYRYPPPGPDPLAIDEGSFRDLLRSSGKKLASALATDTGLGGLYAEEVCLRAGAKKEAISKELSAADTASLYREFAKITESIRNREEKPALIRKDGSNIDVVPAHMEAYDGNEKTFYNSFNDAIDEFFSREEFNDKKEESDSKLEGEMEKLRGIESKQNEVIARFEKDSVESKEIGDLIYQHFSALEELVKRIKEERDKGGSWDEIRGKVRGREYGGVFVEDLSKEGFLVIKAAK